MLLAVKLITLGLLSVLIYQDFKDRLISIWLFPFLIAGVSYLSWCEGGDIFFKMDLLFNIFLVGVQLFVLWLYFRIRGKSVADMLGAGDVLFFVVLCFGLSTIGFVFFFCFSLLVSLIIWIIVRGQQGGYIPLAGMQAACLALYIIAGIIFPSFSIEGDVLPLINLKM